MGNRFRNWFRRSSESAKPPELAPWKAREVLLNDKIFGRGLKTETMPVSLGFTCGGVGDYINWCSAVEFIRKEHPHADIRLYTSPLFIEVLQYLFGKQPGWAVIERKWFSKFYELNSLCRIPKPNVQYMNACGSHLMDVGFQYFACTGPPPPEYNYMVQIDYDGPWKWHELEQGSKYAVFTPGSTASIREMPVTPFNDLVDYTLSKGITPVFLGKRELVGGYNAKFLGYDYTKGVDLRERTSLLEAVQVMRGAQFVIGLDNGLLHMAGTTNVPVIFGHNITQIHHRNLRRRAGLTVNLTIDDAVLSCIGCQSKMRFVINHDFRQCFFKDRPDKDRKCVELLFKNRSLRWKQAIDLVLKERGNFLKKEKTVNMVLK